MFREIPEAGTYGIKTTSISNQQYIKHYKSLGNHRFEQTFRSDQSPTETHLNLIDLLLYLKTKLFSFKDSYS